MGTVCGDLLSPCVCSIRRVARDASGPHAAVSWHNWTFTSVPPPVGVSVISMHAGVDVALSVLSLYLFDHQAVRGIDFYVAASDHRPVEVEVQPVPHATSCHEISSALTGPVDVQEARAVRVGGRSSRKARPGQATGREPRRPASRTATGPQGVVWMHVHHPSAVS